MRKQVYQTCQQAMTNMAANNDIAEEENNCMANDGSGKNSLSHVQRGYTTIYFGSVYINTPLEVCLERNRLRQQIQVAHLTTSSPSSSSSSSRQSIVQQVSDETIVRMSQALEPPALGKASWEVDGAILTLNGCRPIDDLVQEVQQYIQVFYQASSSQSLVAAAAAADLASLPPPVLAMVDPAVKEARLEEERRKTRECFQHQLELLSRHWVAAVARIRPQQARVANQIRKEILLASLFRQDKQQASTTELQKSKAVSTTVESLSDQDGNSNNNISNQATSSAETFDFDMLRREFAEKVWNSTNKTAASSMLTTTWTDEERNQLWMNLSS
jgi:hypothetical protein